MPLSGGLPSRSRLSVPVAPDCRPSNRPVQLPTAVPLDGLLRLRAAPSGPPHEWWKRYQDPTLDQLIELGCAVLAHSGNCPCALRYQRANPCSWRAPRPVRTSTPVPTWTVSASAITGCSRRKLLGFNWYNQADLGLQASYTFDWWGKQRDAVEAAMDQAHAAEADRSAAALLLASSIADTYFGWQADQNRLALARERAGVAEREGKIAAERVRADLDPADDIGPFRSRLGSAREQIAALEGSAQLRVVALAGLIGRSMAELAHSSQVKPLPALSGNLPDDVKIDLIARRADITASRWRVEAAERSLDSARAEFFPDVTINALLGLSSIDVGKLLEYGSRVPQASCGDSFADIRRGPAQGTLWRFAGRHRFGGRELSRYSRRVPRAKWRTQASTRAQIVAQRNERLLEVDAAHQAAGHRSGARAAGTQRYSG